MRPASHGASRVLLVVAVLTAGCGLGSFGDPGPIKVGVLHSLTGAMSLSERPVVDAVMMAIDELNASGGVLGRRVEAVVADGASDPAVFAREAERLISEARVAAVFGCWTSASRKTVRPVFERLDHLLFYPLQYEGLEESANIVYLGAAPNQQIIPAVKWAFGNLGKRFVLIGSDYVFPRAANAIIRDQLRKWHGETLAEIYVPLGGRDLTAVVREIARLKPDAILNTLNGDSNIPFFEQLRAAGVTAPTMSFSIAEEELQKLPAGLLAGDFAAWTYFQSIATRDNQRFVGAFKKRYGEGRVTSDPMEAAYVGVHLWAAAATDAGSVRAADVRAAVTDRSFRGPGGMIYLDGENRHTWKTVRIGKVLPSGQFEIVWSSNRPIRPEPFPSERSREEWADFLDKMYKGWNGNWANPVPVVSFHAQDPTLAPQVTKSTP
jgi:urea transport system substrate-binding protein